MKARFISMVRVSVAGAVLCCLWVTALGVFPLQSCSVTDFGAKGDNVTEDTSAIQKALNSCQTVTFPAPGKYLTRSLSLTQSNQDVVVQSGATIVCWSVRNYALVRSCLLFFVRTRVLDIFR